MPARPLSRQQFDSAFRNAVREAVKTEALIDSIVPNSVPISGVSRGHFRKEYGGASDITVSSTSFTDLKSPELVASMICTGRPVVLECNITALEDGPSGSTAFSFSIDGDEVTGRTNGCYYTDLTNGIVIGASFSWELTPDPGSHVFSVVVKEAVANSTVYAGASNTIQFRGWER